MKQPKIIIPTQPQNLQEAGRLLRAAERVGDAVEIWLDGIADFDSAKFQQILTGAKLPIILNLKDAAEQGKFRGGTKQRLQILSELADCIKNQNIFLDLPLTLPLSRLKKFRATHKKVGLILSWHDFDSMPSLARLRQLARKAKTAGADITKLVGMAKRIEDNYPILQITRELVDAKQACLTMAMGELGQVSRVFTPLLGGCGSFAALDKKSASASGQLTAQALKKWWQDFS